MKAGFITFGAPDIGDAEVQAVTATLRSGWLGTGPRVAEFEAAMAAYRHAAAAQAVALNSCTAALHLSLLAAGVGPGDEVVTPALTFCSAANAVLHTGATPVLADVDAATMNMNADGLRAVRELRQVRVYSPTPARRERWSGAPGQVVHRDLPHDGEAGRAVDRDAGGSSDLGGDLHHQVGHAPGLRAEAELAGLQLAGQKHLVDHLVHAGHGLLDEREHFLALVGGQPLAVVVQQLHRRQDGRQRRAEFVRGHRYKA